MTFEQIKYFIALAENMSFTKTADKLYVSQPTLSRNISDLEYSLGIKLVSRDKNNLIITEAGKLLLEMGNRILDQTFELESRLMSLARGSNGSLKITCPGLNYSPIFSVFNDFAAAYPNIDYKIETAEMWKISEALNKKQTDIGIGFSFAMKREEPDLTIIHIGADRFCLLVSPGHPFAQRSSVRVDELEGVSLIRYGDSSYKAQLIYDLYQRTGLDEQHGPNIHHTINSLENALLQLKLVGGAMIIPSVMAHSLPSGVKMVDIDDKYVNYRILVAWNNINANPAIILLSKFLEQHGCFRIDNSFT